jgi:hypothetical protein
MGAHGVIFYLFIFYFTDTQTLAPIDGVLTHSVIKSVK